METYQRLEREFSDWAGLPNTVACSSGTAALHLALEAFRFPLGSSVIVPEYTMVACARAVILAGLRPIFVDCGKDLLLRTDLLDAVVRPDTVAIMPVHIYGRICDLKAIHDWAWKRSIYVVEDRAEAHGAATLDKFGNSLSHAQCYSFYRNKVIAGEEGGMVSFSDPARADLARCLRSLGATPKNDYDHLARGMNYRLSNSLAETIRNSLDLAPFNIPKRARLSEVYSKHLPKEWHMPPRETNWVYDILLPPEINTFQVVRRLQEKMVEARLGFKPMSSQEEFLAPHFKTLLAWEMSQRIIHLPLSPRLMLDEVVQICNLLQETVHEGLSAWSI